MERKDTCIRSQNIFPFFISKLARQRKSLNCTFCSIFHSFFVSPSKPDARPHFNVRCFKSPLQSPLSVSCIYFTLSLSLSVPCKHFRSLAVIIVSSVLLYFTGHFLHAMHSLLSNIFLVSAISELLLAMCITTFSRHVFFLAFPVSFCSWSELQLRGRGGRVRAVGGAR